MTSFLHDMRDNDNAMSHDDARGIIRRLALKHKEFQLYSVQIQNDTFFMTFALIDKSLNTVDGWIRAAGGVPVYVSIQGTKDNQVMTALVK